MPRQVINSAQVLLGLDSEFGTLEGAVTPLIVDMNLFPKIRKELVSGKLVVSAKPASLRTASAARPSAAHKCLMK